MLVNTVRDDLRVGLRTDPVSVTIEFGAQRLVIFDDAVMHDREAVVRDVWVRVALAGHAVRGPTRVRDAERPMARREVERILQRLNLANRAQASQVMGIVHDGDARGVVTPILQPPQSLHEDGNDITLSDCSDDSTHAYQVLVAARRPSL